MIIALYGTVVNEIMHILTANTSLPSYPEAGIKLVIFSIRLMFSLEKAVCLDSCLPICAVVYE